MWAYLGDHARAAAEVEDATGAARNASGATTSRRPPALSPSARLPPAPPRTWPGPSESGAASAYATGAVQYLARAYATGVLQGPEEREFLLHDPDFAALHHRPDFQLLMMDLGFPTEPFASGG